MTTEDCAFDQTYRSCRPCVLRGDARWTIQRGRTLCSVFQIRVVRTRRSASNSRTAHMVAVFAAAAALL